MNLINKAVVPFNFEGLTVTTESTQVKPVPGRTMRLGQATGAANDHTIISMPTTDGKVSSASVNRMIYLIALLFAIAAGVSFFLLKIPVESSMSSGGVQVVSTDQFNEDQVYKSVQQHPYFLGGKEALKRYLSTRIEEAGANFTKGTVYIQVVVGINGEILDPKILKGVNPSQNEVALGIVQSMPAFMPGRNEGARVKVEMVMAVEF